MSPGARDRAVERMMLDHGVRLAQGEFGIDCGSFTAAVEGLELSEDLDGDPLRELIDGIAAVAVHALREIQRLGLDKEHHPVSRDLLQVVKFAAAADAYALRAARQRKSEVPES